MNDILDTLKHPTMVDSPIYDIIHDKLLASATPDVMLSAEDAVSICTEFIDQAQAIIDLVDPQPEPVVNVQITEDDVRSKYPNATGEQVDDLSSVGDDVEGKAWEAIEKSLS